MPPIPQRMPISPPSSPAGLGSAPAQMGGGTPYLGAPSLPGANPGYGNTSWPGNIQSNSLGSGAAPTSAPSMGMPSASPNPSGSGQIFRAIQQPAGQQRFGGYGYPSPAAAASGQATPGGLPAGFKPPHWGNPGIDWRSGGANQGVLGNGTANPAAASPTGGGINSHPGMISSGHMPVGAPVAGRPVVSPPPANAIQPIMNPAAPTSAAPATPANGLGSSPSPNGYGPGGSAPGLTPAQQFSFNIANSGGNPSSVWQNPNNTPANQAAATAWTNQYAPWANQTQSVGPWGGTPRGVQMTM